MPRILVSASFTDPTLARQTPGFSGMWGDFQYLFEPDGEPVDGWVVYDDLKKPMSQWCPLENTLLITGEPKSLRRYRSRYTSQFGQIWTSHTDICHRHVTIKNESQPWHYGMYPGSVHGNSLNFDDLVALQCPEKPQLLSVICSSKSSTDDHRRRLGFVQYLQSQLGDKVDVFGNGLRFIADKSEAIWPYKYHIVLENDHSDHFMTEKLPDAFLGWSYPIYFGGTEVNKRFSRESFTSIDIYSPEEAVKKIQDVVSSNLYDHAKESIAKARENVLWKYNLFAMLTEYWQSNLKCNSPSKVTLLPKSHRRNLILRQVYRTMTNRPIHQNAA